MQGRCLKSPRQVIQDSSGRFSLECLISKVDKYRRGRPAADKPRTPIGREYILEVIIEQDQAALAHLRLEAGCFVLLSNLTVPQDYSNWSAKVLLDLYKDQSGIEQNFSFLKDPVIVNSIFLKKPKRIEALGLVLLVALLILRLIKRSMRKYIETTGTQKQAGKRNRQKSPLLL